MATSAFSLNRDTLAADPRLGPYRVLGSLGTGSTSEVFKAEHRHLRQFRALKILHPEISARAEVVARLVMEARTMARLRHPSIAEVFECDVLSDGTAFIAMEYLRGEPMRMWLERVGKLREHPLLAAAIAGALAEALLFAHEQSVVHRDLKPENILLVADPNRPGAFALKILDFGIAKLLREEPLVKTRMGCVVGTPGYMAPEQWRAGSPIDHRADIYALGCLLFELLCGRAVFVERHDLGLMRAHLHDPAPSVTSLAPGLPPALDRLIGCMLAKSPDDRPQSLAEVIRELESVVGHRRFTELLRLPVGWSLVARRTLHVESTRATYVIRPLVSPGRWAAEAVRLARRTLRALAGVRRRELLLGGLGVLVGAGALAAWLPASLPRGSDPASSPARLARVTAPPLSPLARITATPPPAGRPQSEPFSVRVSSVPAGVETWVEGEATPRGRTPIDLTFGAPGPRLVRLVAPGFRGKTLSVQVGHDAATKVVLVRQAERDRTPPRRPPAELAERPASVRCVNVYEKVGD